MNEDTPELSHIKRRLENARNYEMPLGQRSRIGVRKIVNREALYSGRKLDLRVNAMETSRNLRIEFSRKSRYFK